MPRTALVAGALGIAGTLPIALLVGAAVALGGLWGDTGVEWWLYPLLAAPLLQLWGSIELLIGRSWWLLVVTCLPGAALLAYLVYHEALRRPGPRLVHPGARGAGPGHVPGRAAGGPPVDRQPPAVRPGRARPGLTLRKVS